MDVTYGLGGPQALHDLEEKGFFRALQVIWRWCLGHVHSRVHARIMTQIESRRFAQHRQVSLTPGLSCCRHNLTLCIPIRGTNPKAEKSFRWHACNIGAAGRVGGWSSIAPRFPLRFHFCKN